MKKRVSKKIKKLAEDPNFGYINKSKKEKKLKHPIDLYKFFYKEISQDYKPQSFKQNFSYRGDIVDGLRHGEGS